MKRRPSAYPPALSLAFCRSCGDLCSEALTFNGAARCETCYRELAHGEIVCQNVQISFGGTGTREDDGGPWQQNAVRELEDV